MLEEAQNRLTDLAAAVADGQVLDWDAVESSSRDETERLLVRRLRAIADIGRAHAGVTLSDSFSFSTALPGGFDPAVGHESPMTWGSLRILEKIGRGRFGDVYRAWDPSLDREVALKLLRHRDAAPDSTAEDQAVVEEGRLMARVRHPNVVTIFGAQRIDGRTGLWMEYIQGRTLEAELKERGPFSASEVAQVGIELCGALGAVHAAGLVHRDVKAQNVLRDLRGHVLLGDFGTGRELDDEGSSRDIAGTPAYLAPEIFQRNPATRQSDLYSLGALLFHLATGSFPVSGRSLRDLREAHTQGRRTRMQALCPDFPKALTEVIEKALDPDPACRFADAAAMEATLGSVIAPRSTWKWLVAAGTVAVAGVALAFAVSQDGQAPSGGAGVAGAVLSDDTQPSRRLGDRAIWTGREVDMFGRVSPDGRLISYVDWFGYGDLAVHDIAAYTNRLLTHKSSWPDMNTGWAGYSVFSPDSSQLAYEWHDDHEIGVRILSPSSTATAAKPRQLIRFDRKDVRFGGPLDWSPDGRLIALSLSRTDGSGQIIVASVTDGSFRVLKSVDWSGPEHIFFSPDSRYVAYDLSVSESSDQHDVYVLAIDGSRETVVAAHPANEWVIGWTPDGSHLLFSSDRTGSNGLWAVPMASGKPAGRPELVRPDIGLEAYSLGLTSSGAAVVFKAVSSRDVRVQGIDLSAGRLVGPPVAFTQGFVPGTQTPNWSADGKWLAYQACLFSRCVVIRNVESGAVRRLSQRQVGYTPDPRWSPDGSALLIGGRDTKGRDGIFRFDVKTDSVTAITYRPDLRSSPRWSADGSKIYFDGRDGDKNRRIVERNLRSGAERDVFFGSVQNFEVSPDGTQLAVMTELDPATTTARMLIVPLSGGRPRELTRFTDQEFPRLKHSFAWLPDSRTILATRRSAGGSALWLVPSGQGQPRRLDIDIDEWALADPDSVGDNGGLALSPDGTRIAYLVGRSAVEVWALENVLPEAQPAGDNQARADQANLTGQLETATGGVALRKLWSDPNIDNFSGGISPDGRFLTYAGRFNTTLILRDLIANTERPLTPEDSRGTWASAISKDGARVAYDWCTRERCELWVTSLAAGSGRDARGVFTNASVKSIVPFDWSPDGSRVAVTVQRHDNTVQIGHVTVIDGQLHVLKSVDWRGPTRMFFSADGKDIAYDIPESSESEDRDVFVLAVDGSREIPAVVRAGSDVVMGWTPDGRQLLFASDRTGAMGLWALPFGGGRPQGAPNLLKADLGNLHPLGLSRAGALYATAALWDQDIEIVPVDLVAGKQTGAAARPIVRFTGANTQPAWSTDGKWLAYRSARGTALATGSVAGPSIIGIRPASGGDGRELRPQLAWFQGLTWTPDSRAFVAWGDDLKGRRGIFRVDAQTGGATMIGASIEEEGDAPTYEGFFFSPDSRRIYYHTRNGSVRDRELSSGAERTIVAGNTLPSTFDVPPPEGQLGPISGSPDGRWIVAQRTSDAGKSNALVAMPIGGANRARCFA